MLDSFDAQLLNCVQQDDSRTAESLAREVALSPSAIARRLRRLRANGWIARTIALLAPRLTQNRLRAILLIRFADVPGRLALERQLAVQSAVQFCYEVSGPHDLVVLIDCTNMAEFTSLEHELLATSPSVRRWETLFVKREIKFAPFVELRQPAEIAR